MPATTGPDEHRYLSLSGATIDRRRRRRRRVWRARRADVDQGHVADGEDTEMWGMVAAMILLGNVDFGSGDNAADRRRRHRRSQPAEGLLGVRAASSKRATALLKRSIKIGVNGETIARHDAQAGAMQARDALVKIMYARLFATSSCASTRRSTTRRATALHRPARRLRLRVLRGQLVRAALHQLRQREAAAVLPETVFENEANAVQGGGRAVDADRVRRQQGHHRPLRERHQRHLQAARLAVPRAQHRRQDLLRAAAQGARQVARLRARPSSRARRRAPRTTTSSSSTLRATSSTSRASSSRRTTTRSRARGRGALLHESSKPVIADGLHAGGHRRRRRRRAARRAAVPEGQVVLRVRRRQVRQVAQGADDGAAVASQAHFVRCIKSNPERSPQDARRVRDRPAAHVGHARRGAPHPGGLPDAHPVRGSTLRYKYLLTDARHQHLVALARRVLRGRRRGVRRRQVRVRARRAPHVLQDGRGGLPRGARRGRPGGDEAEAHRDVQGLRAEAQGEADGREDGDDVDVQAAVQGARRGEAQAKEEEAKAGRRGEAQGGRGAASARRRRRQGSARRGGGGEQRRAQGGGGAAAAQGGGSSGAQGGGGGGASQAQEEEAAKRAAAEARGEAEEEEAGGAARPQRGGRKAKKREEERGDAAQAGRRRRRRRRRRRSATSRR